MTRLRLTGLEDGGFRGLPGGRRWDASVAAHPPLGEVAAGGAELWDVGLRDADREWAVSRGASRLWRSRGQGRGKVTSLGGDGSTAAGLGAGTGIPLRAQEPRSDTPTQFSVPISCLIAAGPAEVACLAEHGHLRPGPAEPARNANQPAGQRAASGLGAVLTAYLHGEWGPLSRGDLVSARESSQGRV